ncbi:MAG: glycosyltransferase family 4 protein [Dehalococcoidia bacterium]
MRLLITAHHWPPHTGGLEIVAWEMARRLARRGYRVTVVTSAAGLDKKRGANDTDKGYSLCRIPAWDGLDRWWGIPYPIFAPSLVTTLRRLTPHHDLVLAHSHVFLTSVAAALAARQCHKPLVVYQHTPFIHYHFPWNLVEHGADRLLGQWPLRWASLVAANSQHTARYVKALAPKHAVEVVYPGVDTERFVPVSSPDERKALRLHLGLPDNAFIALAVGRLTFKKGFDTLLSACAHLRYCPDVQIVLVGDGPERPVLEKRVRQQRLPFIRLWGALPFEAMPGLYRAADALVFPSRTGEGFGLVILEAFASGLPVVATSAGGQAEVVQDGKTGFIVPPEAPETLAQAILALKNNPSLAQKMAIAARAKALEMDWERFADRWARLLEHLIHSHTVAHASA